MEKGNDILHIQANTYMAIPNESVGPLYPCCCWFLDLETLVSSFPLITNLCCQEFPFILSLGMW
jgi:hypothetical protein